MATESKSTQVERHPFVVNSKLLANEIQEMFKPVPYKLLLFFCDLRVFASKLQSPFGHLMQFSMRPMQVQLAGTFDYLPDPFVRALYGERSAYII